MPPTLVSPSDAAAGAETDAGVETPSATEIHEALDAAQAAETAEEQFERRAGELREGPATPAPAPEPGIEVASSAAAPLPQSSDTPPVDMVSAPAASADEPQPEAPSEAPSDAQQAAQEPHAESDVESDVEAANAEPERRAPRGRFERFYAPGQGPRAERNGHGAPPTHAAPAANGATHGAANGAANGATRRPTRDPLRDSLRDSLRNPLPSYNPSPDPSAAQVPEEAEEELRPSGPREDVRGAVGGLIDALHDLFTQDRSVATQGGSSRCGLCYLHFPIGELVYRESEGFYVCQACERALGSARVNMVRRQQKL